MASETANTNNHDLAGYVRRINRFAVEWYSSVSASTSYLNANDMRRANSYLAALRSYHDWVLSQNELDLPESHPTPIEVATPGAPALVENEAMIDLITMAILMRTELLKSQTSQIGSGMISHDALRFESMLAKMQAFLDTYVADTTPLDLPESSPMRGDGTVSR